MSKTKYQLKTKIKFATRFGICCICWTVLMFWSALTTYYIRTNGLSKFAILESPSTNCKFGTEIDNHTVEQLEACHVPNLSKQYIGQPHKKTKEERQRLYNEFGYDAVLSDNISLDRMLEDVRPIQCRFAKFTITDLPKVSVIIIFYNEYLSVLLRTVHSLLNHTPDELLNEIILVDDKSTLECLQNTLDVYLQCNARMRKVRLVRNAYRSGLMKARMQGARSAMNSSEVLVFLDSHFEFLPDWLPPLLAPIERNPRTCTAPAIDRVMYDTFKHVTAAVMRRFFNWNVNIGWFTYRRRSKQAEPYKSFRNYILHGAAIVIAADFFWQLGGFDEGMRYWGGEQIELSFKIWLCGGEVVEVPCARLAHLYRDPQTKGNVNLYGNYDFLDRNNRRIVDAWLDDEHRRLVFKRSPWLAAVKDAGDVKEQHAVREKLHCKSFSWAMKHIFTDIESKFPKEELSPFGHGVIASVGAKGYCFELMAERVIGLGLCDANKAQPSNSRQKFFYNFKHELYLNNNRAECLEAPYGVGKVSTYQCHNTELNQYWVYNPTTKYITWENDYCVVALPKTKQVRVEKCLDNNPLMQWEFGVLHKDALLKFMEKEKTFVFFSLN